MKLVSAHIEDARELYEERAAIIEFDAGMTREQAQRRARIVYRALIVEKCFRHVARVEPFEARKELVELVRRQCGNDVADELIEAVKGERESMGVLGK